MKILHDETKAKLKTKRQTTTKITIIIVTVVKSTNVRTGRRPHSRLFPHNAYYDLVAIAIAKTELSSTSRAKCPRMLTARLVTAASRWEEGLNWDRILLQGAV